MSIKTRRQISLASVILSSISTGYDEDVFGQTLGFNIRVICYELISFGSNDAGM